jgi:endosialidase-like protein
LNNSGSNNIAVASNAGANLTTGSNNIDIGNVGVAAEAGKIRIGTAGAQTATLIATLIAGIYNVSEGGTIKAVYINSTGRLGTQPPASARKFKEEIKAMEKASEAILKLKPVSFRYKNDEERTPQFGLIAEEVANVNPDLVVRDEHGEVYTVRYDAVNAMLLNEFLKEHKTVQELKSAAAKHEAIIARQQKQIEALSAGLQKVSAQLELRKPAPQTVLNNR